ncbi:sugar transferase [Micrococcus lylae]|uniref:Lipid carrier: UDP-N-acetylgalactosaminyltransferase n=1 Tax=Micrococcus lylae TaxID=1273 RepID=A0A1R4J9P5_9MICC|nr:sugar transferase [Micrococcus lylae]SJN28515.1 Lipid carrier : UDP-N-acetylgalactosaminyltransferase [Micrococcus lylae]
MLTPDSSYEEKFSALNQRMRWEVADELRAANLDHVNRLHPVVEPRDTFYTRYGKRALDIGLSGGALLASSPVIGALCLVTLKDLGRPILFTQERPGRLGKKFRMVKLRTMRNAYDDQGKPLLGELRVTKMGRLIRRASLDELLNFWNIFKGDMSLIGPRPLVPEYVERFSDRHRQRMAVKPGLECPTPRPPKGPMSYDDQFENDCWYVENVSLKTDAWLMFRVLQTALDRRQNKARGSSSRGSFMGYDREGRVITTAALPAWALDKVLIRNGLMTAPAPHAQQGA